MTQFNDTWVPKLSDIPAALGLLTRLPIPVNADQAQKRGARAAWTYPLVGIVVAILAYLTGLLAQRIELPELVLGFFIVGVIAFVTGAMHEDGLADTLDGFWGGWDRTRRLEIMKDSTIGVYGTVGLVCVLPAKAALYGVVFSIDPWLIVVILSGSRAMMVPVMTALPHARESGLSQSVGPAPVQTAVTAVLIATALAMIIGGIGAIIPMALAAFAIGFLAKRKIGGQTGDVLGCVQQVSELAGLIALVMLNV